MYIKISFITFFLVFSSQAVSAISNISNLTAEELFIKVNQSHIGLREVLVSFKISNEAEAFFEKSDDIFGRYKVPNKYTNDKEIVLDKVEYINRQINNLEDLVDYYKYEAQASITDIQKVEQIKNELGEILGSRSGLPSKLNRILKSGGKSYKDLGVNEDIEELGRELFNAYEKDELDGYILNKLRQETGLDQLDNLVDHPSIVLAQNMAKAVKDGKGLESFVNDQQASIASVFDNKELDDYLEKGAEVQKLISTGIEGIKNESMVKIDFAKSQLEVFYKNIQNPVENLGELSGQIADVADLLGDFKTANDVRQGQAVFNTVVAIYDPSGIADPFQSVNSYIALAQGVQGLLGGNPINKKPDPTQLMFKKILEELNQLNITIRENFKETNQKLDNILSFQEVRFEKIEEDLAEVSSQIKRLEEKVDEEFLTIKNMMNDSDVASYWSVVNGSGCLPPYAYALGEQQYKSCFNKILNFSTVDSVVKNLSSAKINDLYFLSKNKEEVGKDSWFYKFPYFKSNKEILNGYESNSGFGTDFTIVSNMSPYFSSGGGENIILPRPDMWSKGVDTLFELIVEQGNGKPSGSEAYFMHFIETGNKIDQFYKHLLVDSNKSMRRELIKSREGDIVSGHAKHFDNFENASKIILKGGKNGIIHSSAERGLIYSVFGKKGKLSKILTSGSVKRVEPYYRLAKLTQAKESGTPENFEWCDKGPKARFQDFQHRFVDKDFSAKYNSYGFREDGTVDDNGLKRLNERSRWGMDKPRKLEKLIGNYHSYTGTGVFKGPDYYAEQLGIVDKLDMCIWALNIKNVKFKSREKKPTSKFVISYYDMDYEFVIRGIAKIRGSSLDLRGKQYFTGEVSLKGKATNIALGHNDWPNYRKKDFWKGIQASTSALWYDQFWKIWGTSNREQEMINEGAKVNNTNKVRDEYLDNVLYKEKFSAQHKKYQADALAKIKKDKYFKDFQRKIVEMNVWYDFVLQNNLKYQLPEVKYRDLVNRHMNLPDAETIFKTISVQGLKKNEFKMFIEKTYGEFFDEFYKAVEKIEKKEQRSHLEIKKRLIQLETYQALR